MPVGCYPRLIFPGPPGWTRSPTIGTNDSRERVPYVGCPRNCLFLTSSVRSRPFSSIWGGLLFASPRWPVRSEKKSNTFLGWSNVFLDPSNAFLEVSSVFLIPSSVSLEMSSASLTPSNTFG